MNPTADPDGLALAEVYLLRELETPEARALLVRVLREVEARIESRTSNPVLKSFEESAFAVVRNYISPTPPVI